MNDNARPQGTTVTLERVRVVHDSNVVLNDLDLHVEAGERIAIRGPSGAGKSTLLRAIAGLVTLQSGTIRLDGHDVTSVPAHRRGVGLVFQDSALFTHLDVAKNIEFGLKMLRWDRVTRARRVAELLQLVALQGFDARDVTTLSGGERQRVALARALAPSPRVLLLDEPVASLDDERKAILLPELAEILRRIHTTTITVTHDADEAALLSTRVVWLSHGRITPDHPTPRELS